MAIVVRRGGAEAGVEQVKKVHHDDPLVGHWTARAGADRQTGRTGAGPPGTDQPLEVEEWAPANGLVGVAGSESDLSSCDTSGGGSGAPTPGHGVWGFSPLAFSGWCSSEQPGQARPAARRIDASPLASMCGRSEEGEGAGGWGRREEAEGEGGSGTQVLGFRIFFIRSKHDFIHWIDDRWSIIAGPVGLKRA
jgi:hypothetical protein